MAHAKTGMTSDPRTEPLPGDTLRDPMEDFPRKVLRRESARVLTTIGKGNHAWVNLSTWRKWAAQERVVIAPS
jgi:hypothetical protein